MAIFLYVYTGGKHLYEYREGGEIAVVPNERGKTVVENRR